jgi:hypothetical protein
MNHLRKFVHQVRNQNQDFLPSSRKEQSEGTVSDTENGGKGLGLTVNQWLTKFFVPPPLYNLIFMVSAQISFTTSCFDKKLMIILRLITKNHKPSASHIGRL